MGVNWLGLGVKLLDTLVDVVSPYFRFFILHFLSSLLFVISPHFLPLWRFCAYNTSQLIITFQTELGTIIPPLTTLSYMREAKTQPRWQTSIPPSGITYTSKETRRAL